MAIHENAPKRSRRWAVICGLVAAIYAVPVAFAVWSNFPTERQIDADTASSVMAALQQSDVKYSNATPQVLRRRLYRGLSDQEVIARVREQATTDEQRMAAQSGRIALGGEETVVGSIGGSPLGDASLSAQPMRSPLSIALDDIDRLRAERIAGLNAARIKAIALGVLAWIAPVIVLYVLGPRVRGLRSRRLRRI